MDIDVLQIIYLKRLVKVTLEQSITQINIGMPKGLGELEIRFLNMQLTGTTIPYLKFNDDNTASHHVYNQISTNGSSTVNGISDNGTSIKLTYSSVSYFSSIIKLYDIGKDRNTFGSMLLKNAKSSRVYHRSIDEFYKISLIYYVSTQLDFVLAIDNPILGP